MVHRGQQAPAVDVNRLLAITNLVCFFLKQESRDVPSVVRAALPKHVLPVLSWESGRMNEHI